MRQTVGNRPADHGNICVLVVNGGHPKQGNQGPADHVAEGNGRYTGDNLGSGPAFEG
ncbi:MAG: hypothetical protein HGJ93_05745 [Desulfosarcina sp.]|nr:hypothetical protein [Desulfosarcina sp.]MBC2765458.1 hypothetical protein [Desulfosarcina sp.]